MGGMGTENEYVAYVLCEDGKIESGEYIDVSYFQQAWGEGTEVSESFIRENMISKE